MAAPSSDSTATPSSASCIQQIYLNSFLPPPGSCTYLRSPVKAARRHRVSPLASSIAANQPTCGKPVLDARLLSSPYRHCRLAVVPRAALLHRRTSPCAASRPSSSTTRTRALHRILDSSVRCPRVTHVVLCHVRPPLSPAHLGCRVVQHGCGVAGPGRPRSAASLRNEFPAPGLRPPDETRPSAD